jgi:hypothetical protein
MPDLRGDVRAERVQKRTANQDSKRRQGATVAPQPESERSVEDAERCPPPKTLGISMFSGVIFFSDDKIT